MKRRLFPLAAAASLLLCLLLACGWIQSYRNPIFDVTLHERHDHNRLLGFSSHGQLGFTWEMQRLPSPFPTIVSTPPSVTPSTVSAGPATGVAATSSRTVSYVAVLYADPSTIGKNVLGYHFDMAHYADTVYGFPQSQVFANIPYIIPTALTAILPTLAFFFWRRTRIRRHRVVQNHCAYCGYDLRASTDRCPECGTAITT